MKILLTPMFYHDELRALEAERARIDAKLEAACALQSLVPGVFNHADPKEILSGGVHVEIRSERVITSTGKRKSDRREHNRVTLHVLDKDGTELAMVEADRAGHYTDKNKLMIKILNVTGVTR